MIHYFWTKSSLSGLDALLTVCTFVLAFASFKLFARFLPKDHGREFAVNGELSQGKPRGAGIILVSVFTLCAALFSKMNAEQAINLGLIYAAMLTGYLDDAAKVPWGELKKGLLDLVISAGVSVNYVFRHSADIYLFDTKIELPKAVYAVLGIVLVWASINVVNCTDGVDGLCASLSMVTIAAFAVGYVQPYSQAALVMLAVLAAYLWFNCSPSMMLMGDAGSRALGVFIALLAMQSRHPIAFIPLALVMIIDGGLGLVKLTIRRVLHSKTFMDGIRTPIHDHARKNKGFGDTQVVTRFTLIQLLICAAVIFLR